MSDAQDAQADVEIVARAATYYRMTRYLIVLLFLGYGLWSIRDGFYVWPEENARIERGELKATPHGDLDLALNKLLGVVLPPLALAMLARALYNSRGAYRLSGNTLHVPGHPPIPLEQIRRIDKRRWDRKGIALIEYELPGTERLAQFKLDDFVYDRKPTDQILQRIEAYATAEPQEQPTA